MFNLPNLLTASNLLCGVTALIFALMGRIDLAPYPVFLAGIFDFLDGFLARKLKVSGELGKQLDSLADMVTFGVVPGVVMFVVFVLAINYGDQTPIDNFSSYTNYVLTEWRNAVFYGVQNQLDTPLKFMPFFALIIPFLSLFRLAKFNIDTRQSESFIGLNTPANTLFFMTFPLALNALYGVDFHKSQLVFVLLNPAFLFPVVGGMSLLLISELPMFSFKFKHFKWKENELRYLFLITCALIISFLLVWSLAIIVLLYILLSIIENNFLKNTHNEIQS